MDVLSWLHALRQLIIVLQVSTSACLAALVVKGSLTSAKLSAIVSLATAALDGCAALVLDAPSRDSLSMEEQQQVRRILLRPLLGYGSSVIFNTSSGVSHAQELGHDSLVDLLEAGPANPAAFLRYAGAFLGHALTANGRLHASIKDMQGRRPHCT
jgi:hypothetical protein